MVSVGRITGQEPRVSAALTSQVRAMARPLRGADDLDPLLEFIGDARYVLLGEASHGTADYYTWRTEISRRLIVEQGFSFIAVEGDWPDCYRVNRYVKGLDDAGETAREVLHAFGDWPTWMWANQEVVTLAEWLRRHNDGRPDDQKAGFYGLDVYSLWESLYAIMAYLQRNDPSALRAAWRALRCFEPYGEDVQEYAHATRFVPDSCEDEVVGLLRELRRSIREHPDDGREARFAAEQNALVLKNAEAYYRSMVRGGPESWNLRDSHMAGTLERLMKHHGPRAKAIVWEHNTHIGDARYTDMADTGEFNVGQLVRERHGHDGVVLVGFGSYRGRVIAGRRWEAAMQRMRVPPAREGSWEDVLHQAAGHDAAPLAGIRRAHARAAPAAGAPRDRRGLPPRVRASRQLRTDGPAPSLRCVPLPGHDPGAPPPPRGRAATGGRGAGDLSLRHVAGPCGSPSGITSAAKVFTYQPDAPAMGIEGDPRWSVGLVLSGVRDFLPCRLDRRLPEQPDSGKVDERPLRAASSIPSRGPRGGSPAMIPRLCTAIGITAVVLTIRPAMAQDGQRHSTGPEPAYAMVTTSARHVRDQLTFELIAPRVRAQEWVVYLARLPELPSQTQGRSALSQGGRPTRNRARRAAPSCSRGSRSGVPGGATA